MAGRWCCAARPHTHAVAELRRGKATGGSETVGSLIKRCKALGISEESVHAALDAEDPKTALTAMADRRDKKGPAAGPTELVGDSAAQLAWAELTAESLSQLVRRAAEAGVTEEQLAIGETVILLHSPLPLLGVSIAIKRGCHQNDSLADG